MTSGLKISKEFRRQHTETLRREKLEQVVHGAEARHQRVQVVTFHGDVLEGRPAGCRPEYFNLAWGTRIGEEFGEREVYWGEVHSITPIKRAEFTPDRDAFGILGILDMHGCRLVMPGGEVLRATMLHWNTRRGRSLLWRVEGRSDLVEDDDVVQVYWDSEEERSCPNSG